MIRRTVRFSSALLLTCGVVTAALASATPAGADTNLIGWTAQSDANVFDVVVDNASGLAGSHPLSEIDVPEDSSQFETGPLGHALATIFWPGSVAGNFGSLAGELGLPSQLAPVADMLNYPVRAESFYPAGPTDATYPAGAPASGLLEMTSHADGNNVWAKAAIADDTISGLYDLQGVAGSTTATATSMAQSTAAGSFHSLSLLGGLIQIGATSSTASAQSDGNSPSGTSTSHVGAITIAGQPVSIGSDGIVIGPASSTVSGLLSALPTDLINQIVSAINLKITLLPQTETNQAPAEQITSGGLQISFSLPQDLSLHLTCPTLPAQLAQVGIICTLPGLLQGLSYTMTIGRVTAEAIAAPPFAIPVDEGTLGLLSGNNSSLGASSLDLGIPSVPTSATPVPAVQPQGLRHASSVSLSSPIGVALFLILLAVASLFGFGLRRLTTMVGAAPAADCPLEDGS